MDAGWLQEEAGVQICDQSTLGWTVVLRRQRAHLVQGQPQGGYTDVYEIICCDCGDDPGLDYRDVSPELQKIRGPYPIVAGVAAYGEHVELHDALQPIHQAGSRPAGGGQ